MAFIFEGIENYDTMTAEEKLSALEKMEVKEPNDTESKKWKTQYDRTAHELAENKKALKNLQEQLNSRLSEDELAKAEAERLSAERDRELEALKREVAVSKTTAQYIALGYSQELAESTANALYDNDFETVTANAGAYRDALEQTLRASIVKSNPTPDSKGGNGTKGKMTKAEIMAIKDTAKRQKAIADNPEVFGIDA